MCSYPLCGGNAWIATCAAIYDDESNDRDAMTA